MRKKEEGWPRGDGGGAILKSKIGSGKVWTRQILTLKIPFQFDLCLLDLTNHQSILFKTQKLRHTLSIQASTLAFDFWPKKDLFMSWIWQDQESPWSICVKAFPDTKLRAVCKKKNLEQSPQQYLSVHTISPWRQNTPARHCCATRCW